MIINGKSTRKGRAVVDIRELNQITQIDAYPMFAQAEIIAAVFGSTHIFIINVQNYFFQWVVKEENRYKQTVITHRRQEQFNVIVMSFKNFSIYVQKQTNLMFKDFRGFVKTYIDDIVFFSEFLKNHVEHLNKRFQRLSKYDVILNSKKFFFDYFFIILLDQVVDVFEMITAAEKLEVISKLFFFKIFMSLKKYFDLTEWFRNYVFFYVQIAEFLQQRKILLLKSGPIKENFRKRFSVIKMLEHSSNKKYEVYFILQDIFSKSSFLIHFASGKWLLINVNAFKQKKFEVMVFHVKDDSDDVEFRKNDIQSIMFLSKQFFSAEIKY